MSSDPFCQEICNALGLDSIDENLCAAFRTTFSKFAEFVAEIKKCCGRQLTASELKKAWQLFTSGHTDPQSAMKELRLPKQKRHDLGM